LEADLAILSQDRGQVCGRLAGGIGGHWLRWGGDDLLFFIFGLNPVDFIDGRWDAYPSGSHAHSKPDPSSYPPNADPHPYSRSWAKFALSG